MKSWTTPAACAVALGLLGGCSVATPGTTRHLGAVDYASAFASAREVMSEHFSIASADADSGLIESRPKKINAEAERLLGGQSPARQVARIQINRRNGGVAAHASVAVQREGSGVFRTWRSPGENYDEVPNETPAQAAAATTPEQNEAWRTEKYDHALERQMLEQVYQYLHPGEE